MCVCVCVFIIGGNPHLTSEFRKIELGLNHLYKMVSKYILNPSKRSLTMLYTYQFQFQQYERVYQDKPKSHID